LKGGTGLPFPTPASFAYIIRSLRHKATVPFHPEPMVVGGRDLGEDGTETALYQISKEKQLAWKGNCFNLNFI